MPCPEYKTVLIGTTVILLETAQITPLTITVIISAWKWKVWLAESSFFFMSIFSSIHLNYTFLPGQWILKIKSVFIYNTYFWERLIKQKWKRKQAINFCNFLKLTVWEFALHCHGFNKIRVVGVLVLSEIVYFVQDEKEGEREWKSGVCVIFIGYMPR